MESKNLSVMLTDIQGYSKKSATSSRSGLIQLVQTHNNLLRPIIEFYKGRVIKSLGDSFLCVFESATDASVCSIAIQVLVQEYNRHQRKPENTLNIRVIISSGDVTIDEGDIYGEAVNLAARMEKIPELSKGGIGISESTYLLMNRQEIAAQYIGEFEFKGISQPIKVYQIQLDEQKLTQLPTRLLDLVKHVATGTEIPSSLREPFKEVPEKRRPLMVAASIAAALAVAAGLAAAFLNPSKTGTQGQFQVLNWLRMSDVDRSGMIQKKNWKGPPELFAELDQNSDETIMPDEIMTWAGRKGIELPPPPPPGTQ